MKRIQLAVVRSITTEELYDVEVEDSEAKTIEAAAMDKDKLADLVDDAYQKAKRRGEVANYKETGVNDKVTFAKIKVTNVKE